jgi:pimeloyl-ACP methyl ester carboxylesterase
MKERALLFGEHKGMVGVLSGPTAPGDDRPALVILNAGVIHRIGPYRTSVLIARRVASAGFPVLRFDLSGLGDSESRKDALTFEERWIADIRQAMDHLQQSYGLSRFVLLGLCSGADNSFQTARLDERVVGAVMMDGYAYRTPGFFLRYYGPRVLSADVWLRWLRRVGRAVGSLRRHFRSADAPLEDEPPPPVAQYVRAFPPRTEAAAALRRMIDRGVRLFFIYSAGMEEYYNYRAQFTDAFSDVDFKDRLELAFFAEADHTFTLGRHRRALVEAIASWMTKSFPAASDGTLARDGHHTS